MQNTNILFLFIISLKISFKYLIKYLDILPVMIIPNVKVAPCNFACYFMIAHVTSLFVIKFLCP